MGMKLFAGDAGDDEVYGDPVDDFEAGAASASDASRSVASEDGSGETGLPVLTGSIKHVINYQPDRSSLIARVEADDGGLVTVLGDLYLENEAPRIGMMIRAEGDWVTHPTFGRQFRAIGIIPDIPTSPAGIYRWLELGNVPGLGKVSIEKLRVHFGDDIVLVLEDPEKLREAGLSETQALTLGEAWRENHVADAGNFIWLLGCGLSSAQARSVIETHGEHARARVQRNPWAALADIQGIGLSTMDRIAEKNGNDLRGADRIISGFEEVLRRAARNGSTGVPSKTLLQDTCRLLFGKPFGSLDGGLQDQVRASYLKAMSGPTDQRRFVEVTGDLGKIRFIMQRRIRIAEEGAALVLALLRHAAAMPIDATRVLNAIEGADLPLDKTQQHAVLTMLASRVSCLTGGPGTGKTHLIKAVCAALRDVEPDISIVRAAPTGKAATLLGEDGMTVDRLLEWRPAFKGDAVQYNGGVFLRHEGNPIDADVVIIDESSMLDIEKAYFLLRAIDPERTRLILSGDANQIPSVGAGRFFRDVTNSDVIPTLRLSTIYRERGRGGIAKACQIIQNEGRAPTESIDNYKFHVERSPKSALARLTRFVSDVLPSRGLDPRRDLMVMTPRKAGDLGVYALNRHLKGVINPAGPQTPTIGIGVGEGRYEATAGDVVMHVNKNMLVTQTVDGVEQTTLIANGRVGRIVALEGEDEALDESLMSTKRTCAIVDFDGVEVVYRGADLKNLCLAYALSCHKAQGSQAPVAVTLIDDSHGHLPSRELMYTSMSRGERVSIVMGSVVAFRRAIARVEDTTRQTFLKVFLEQKDQSVRNLKQSLDDQQPRRGDEEISSTHACGP
jgi:exodeoxyribonuclease V alpha subunit